MKVTIGSTALNATFTGASPQFPGLDQVNLPLPAALAGSGDVSVILSADGFVGNTVRISIR